MDLSNTQTIPLILANSSSEKDTDSERWCPLTELSTKDNSKTISTPGREDLSIKMAMSTREDSTMESTRGTGNFTVPISSTKGTGRTI